MKQRFSYLYLRSKVQIFMWKRLQNVPRTPKWGCVLRPPRPLVSCHILLQVEMEKYVRGVQWIRELLYQTKFTPERLKIGATKMMKDMSELKRKGRAVVEAMFKGIMFNQGKCYKLCASTRCIEGSSVSKCEHGDVCFAESNHNASCMFRQHKFLAKVLEKLENSKTAEEVYLLTRSQKRTAFYQKAPCIELHLVERTHCFCNRF